MIWVRVTPASTPVTVTATGTRAVVLVLELFPSWPFMLLPQQYAAPVLPSAQTWYCPTLTWVRVTPDIGVPTVVTATDVSCAAVVVPLPSWPLPPPPQQ